MTMFDWISIECLMPLKDLLHYLNISQWSFIMYMSEW
jgi:hypothetical protein